MRTKPGSLGRLVFMLSAFGAAQLAAPPAAHADLDLPKLQELSKTALRQRWVSVEPASIVIAQGELQYYLGGVSYFLPEQFGDPLLGRVVCHELQVQTLRNLRQTAVGQAFWNNLLPKVERIVSQQLALYLSDRPREQCEAEIAQLTEQIDQTYDSAFADEARRRGLRATPLAAGAGAKTVTLTTNPPGGKVLLLHVLDAQIAAALNRQPQWIEIDPLGPPSVDGQYWYSIQRDGVSSAPKRIDFSADENQFEYVLQ